MTDFPIVYAREFAAALRMPVLTEAVPALAMAARRSHSAGFVDGAAAERVECAVLCEQLEDDHPEVNGYGCAAAIRARGVR